MDSKAIVGAEKGFVIDHSDECLVLYEQAPSPGRDGHAQRGRIALKVYGKRGRAVMLLSAAETQAFADAVAAIAKAGIGL